VSRFDLAQNNLSASYCNGQGVKQDSVEALKWHNRAANQGYDGVQNFFKIYYLGSKVAKDFSKAYF